MGIHKRDEGHGLTFVYFKDIVSLNVVVLFPADQERETETCDQTSVHPLTPFGSLPLTDMEMLLVEHIIQTLVPPVVCHLHHRVLPLPDGTLFVCSGWLNTRSQSRTNMFTNRQSQVGVTGPLC